MTEHDDESGQVEQPGGDGATGPVQDTLRVAAEEGEQRLRRSTTSLLATGGIAGLDVGLGVLAKLSVMEATGSQLLGGLAFSLGFIAILLGRSELFTENFLIPVTAALRKDRTLWSLLRVWGLTGVANLAGGWVMMGLVVVAIPRIATSPILTESASHFIGPVTWQMFASAMLGGAAITLMTWMQQGTRSVVAEIVAVSGVAFVLAGTPLLHSIVTSLEIFAALHATAVFSYLDYLVVLGVAVVGNIVGGVGLVTVLRLVQARAEDHATYDPTTTWRDG